MGAEGAMATFSDYAAGESARGSSRSAAEARISAWLPALRDYQTRRAEDLGVEARGDADLILMIREAGGDATLADLEAQIDLALSWPASLPPPGPDASYQMPGFGLGLGSTAMWITDWIDYCALRLLRRRLPPRPPARPRLL